ncbi:MAG: hypothetical protein IPJ81_02485 [Chitinophagaceae bacterium]|nr:hypothetical protein [Chitinophagaceae bacterium]
MCAFIYSFSCNEKLTGYYSGIIIDELGRPVTNVLVKENVVEKYANKALTDNNGYFKFKKTEGILPDLILLKEGYINDTIQIVGTHAGESIAYSPIITEDSTKITLRGKTHY